MKKYFILIFLLIFCFDLCACESNIKGNERYGLDILTNAVSKMIETRINFDLLLKEELKKLTKNKQVIKRNIELAKTFDNYKNHNDWNKGYIQPDFITLNSKQIIGICSFISKGSVDKNLDDYLSEFIYNEEKKGTIILPLKKTLIEIEKIYCIDDLYKEYSKYDTIDDEKIPMPDFKEIEKKISFDNISDEDFSEGFAPVEINGKYGFINEKRELEIEPQFDEIGEEAFKDGLARVCLDNLWGFINKNGELVINLQYDWVEPFNEEGYSKVGIGDETYFIDKSGNLRKEKVENNYEELLKKRFTVNKSSIIIDITMKNGTFKNDVINYNLRNRIIKTSSMDNKSILWNIPIDYSGGHKTSLAFTFMENRSVRIAIASDDIVLGYTIWENINESPIKTESKDDVLSKITFINDWFPELDNPLMESILIKKDSYIEIKEAGTKDNIETEISETKTNNTKTKNGTTKETNTKEEIKPKSIKLKEFDVNKNDYTEAYVLNVIDFDINLKISLIEVELYGSRRFIKLLGIRTPFNKQTVKFIKDKILYETIYLEKDKNFPDEIDYLNRYVWLNIPTKINEAEVNKKLLNTMLIKKELSYPSLKKETPLKYEDYYLAFYSGNTTSLISNPEKKATPKTPSNIIETKNNIYTDEINEELNSTFDEELSEGNFIGNKSTHKFHKPDCSSAKQIKDENKIYFLTRDEAINFGYEPCKKCNP